MVIYILRSVVESECIHFAAVVRTGTSRSQMKLIASELLFVTHFRLPPAAPRRKIVGSSVFLSPLRRLVSKVLCGAPGSLTPFSNK